MAKDRKFTISRSDRFLGSYGSYGGDNRHEVADDDGVELSEDDVWSTTNDMVNGDTDGSEEHSVGSDWFPGVNVVGGAARSRRRRAGGVPAADGLSAAFDDQPSKWVIHGFGNRGDNLTSARQVASSAPVNVPDSSKIYRVNSIESMQSMHDSDDGTDDHDSEMVPPHEYLARSHRSAAMSVFEGVGRTLKGRDMSRVREAVWSQTGFDG